LDFESQGTDNPSDELKSLQNDAVNLITLFIFSNSPNAHYDLIKSLWVTCFKEVGKPLSMSKVTNMIGLRVTNCKEGTFSDLSLIEIYVDI